MQVSRVTLSTAQRVSVASSKVAVRRTSCQAGQAVLVMASCGLHSIWCQPFESISGPSSSQSHGVASSSASGARPGRANADAEVVADAHIACWVCGAHGQTKCGSNKYARVEADLLEACGLGDPEAAGFGFLNKHGLGAIGWGFAAGAGVAQDQLAREWGFVVPAYEAMFEAAVVDELGAVACLWSFEASG